MVELVERARVLSRLMHEGQVDKGGEDYFLHVERVALAQESDFGRAVGYLHDIVEDTSCSLSDVGVLVGWEVVTAVDALTRREGEKYGEYIERICECGIESVLLVKLADNADNADGDRGLGISKSLRGRYARARGRLRAALAYCQQPRAGGCAGAG